MTVKDKLRKMQHLRIDKRLFLNPDKTSFCSKNVTLKCYSKMDTKLNVSLQLDLQIDMFALFLIIYFIFNLKNLASRFSGARKLHKEGRDPEIVAIGS